MRVLSFFIDRKPVCNLIALYIRVDTGLWYKFTTSDGINIIELEKDEPLEINIEEIDDEFAYPIKKVDLHYINSKIESVKNYMYKNSIDEFNGFYVKLDENEGFSLFEEEGCLKIYNGIKMEDGYSLV